MTPGKSAWQSESPCQNLVRQEHLIMASHGLTIMLDSNKSSLHISAEQLKLLGIDQHRQAKNSTDQSKTMIQTCVKKEGKPSASSLTPSTSSCKVQKIDQSSRLESSSISNISCRNTVSGFRSNSKTVFASSSSHSNTCNSNTTPTSSKTKDISKEGNERTVHQTVQIENSPQRETISTGLDGAVYLLPLLNDYMEHYVDLLSAGASSGIVGIVKATSDSSS